jgi:hypothetical protein
MAPPETAHPSSNCLQHITNELRLRHRKAFELYATVLGTVRARGADPGEPAIREALNKTRQLAEIALDAQRDEVSIEEFLSDALDKVIREAQEIAEEFPLSGPGLETLDSLRHIQASPPDRIRVKTSSLVENTYAACVEAAKNFYSSYLSSPFHVPEISLKIGVANKSNTAFPGRELAFNGSLLFEDDNATGQKHSIVSLRVFPALLDRGCLPALPYILMHEILCHWPQMARYAGPRPRPNFVADPHNKSGKKPEIDPISEGWMDSLAAHVLRKRCVDPDPACWEEADTAHEIHKERTRTNRKPHFQDAPFIEPGAQAAKLVRWLYRTDPNASPSAADPDFCRLSCELNAAGWDYHARKIGCNDIIRACLAHVQEKNSKKVMSALDDAIRDGLLTFRKAGDLTPLLSALEQARDNR